MAHGPVIGWQDLVAGLMGLAALAYLARRWWPKRAGQPSSGCGSCDQGCGTSVPCTTNAPLAPAPHAGSRVIPITEETRRPKA